MSVKIFLNEFHKVITQQQAEMCNEYIVSFLEDDGLPKKDIYYKNNIISEVEYFLSDDENENVIRQEYQNIKLTLYKNLIISGNYRKYDVELIDSNDIILEKRIEVFIDGNSDNVYPIYYKVLDPITNEVRYFEKSHFDTDRNLTYEFSYNLITGNFESLSVLDPSGEVDTDKGSFGPDEIGVGNNPYDFDWFGFEYYQFADPIIPE